MTHTYPGELAVWYPDNIQAAVSLYITLATLDKRLCGPAVISLWSRGLYSHKNSTVRGQVLWTPCKTY